MIELKYVGNRRNLSKGKTYKCEVKKIYGIPVMFVSLIDDNGDKVELFRYDGSFVEE